MNLAAKLDVKKLLDETNHALTVEDVDDIVELNRLGELVTNPAGEHNLLALSMPIECGGYMFWRPSAGMIRWIRDVGSKWFADDPVQSEMFIACCLTFRNGLDVVSKKMPSMKKARRYVAKWCKDISANYIEIMSVISELMPQSNDRDALIGRIYSASDESEREGLKALFPAAFEERVQTSDKYGQMVCMLCKEYNEDPDFWTWTASPQEVDVFCGDYVARLNSKIEARNAGREAGKRSAPIPTPKMEYYKQYSAQLKRMREKWQ